VIRTALALAVVVTLLAVAWWTTRSDAPAPPAAAPVTTTTASASTTSPVASEAAPVVLPPPPFHEYRAPDVDAAPSTRLRLVAVASRRRDVLESDEAWLARHGLSIADRALVPAHVHGVALASSLRTPAGLVAIYGGRYLRLSEPDTTLVLDVQRYLHGPADRPNHMPDAFSDAEYADLIAQKVGWAARRGSILYFDNHHETYAGDSGNRTAFVSAFDLERRALRWRTRPLVARARNFLVLDDAIIAGYGMTREPDFVYVIDAPTGSVVACYDAEAEFRITR